jgi:hypothetical protein
MKKMLALSIILITMSCKQRKEGMLYDNIDYLNLVGLFPVESSKAEFPFFEIKETSIDERILVIWDSKEDFSTKTFTKIKEGWISINNEVIDEDLVSYEVIVLKDEKEIKYGYSKTGGKNILHNIRICDGNQKKEYFFDDYELGSISLSDYFSLYELISKLEVNATAMSSYLIEDEILKVEIELVQNELNLIRKSELCFSIKGKKLDEKSWKPFFLLHKIDCGDYIN